MSSSIMSIVSKNLTLFISGRGATRSTIKQGSSTNLELSSFTHSLRKHVPLAKGSLPFRWAESGGLSIRMANL